MNATERINFIKNALYSEKRVTIADMADKLQVSYPTVRKYFDQITKSDNSISKIRGGLKINLDDDNDLAIYYKRLIKNEKEKKEIAAKALGFVTEKSTVLLDSSSTTFELAKAMLNLAFRFTVLTNGISTARLLSKNENITTIVLPGIIYKNSNTIIDEFSFNFTQQFNIDLFFFSATGLTLDGGFSEYNLQEVRHKAKNIKKAKKAIALIDSSKFGKSSSANFATLEDIHALITDSYLDKESLDLFKTRVNIL